MVKIKEIKPELRDIIEEFLGFEGYQAIFKEFAIQVGYNGDDSLEIKKCLFTPNEDGDIGFSIEGMNELFMEFQLLKQLIDKEPYKSLLTEYPEAIQNIRIVVNKMLNKEDIGEEDLVLIFSPKSYLERRKLISDMLADDTSSKQV